jgi:Tfp pilus assembly protein PilX
MIRAIRSRLAGERGFTMIIAIGVLFVTSLMLVAAFTIANGEVITTHTDTNQKQAYYAALAGVQEYEYKLQANPNYWESCAEPKSSVPEEKTESYEVTPLPASTAPSGTEKCSTSNPFATMIEASGTLANTFRIKSTGFAGKEKKVIIATFKVTGFLDFIYYTNYETEDPALYKAPAGCAEHYYSSWSKAKLSCETITFTSGDSVEGPMHTNDSARVEGSAEFGRPKHVPADAIEILGGTYPEDSGGKCTGGKPVFNTPSGCYSLVGEPLTPPPNDTSLTSYVEAANHFEGQTKLTLEGATNKIAVSSYTLNAKKEVIEVKKTIEWPKNGLIYVSQLTGAACSYAYEATSSDDSTELKERHPCGDVYVTGSYKESLTIASADNVIITGNLWPTSVEGKIGKEPPTTSTAVLGLIAENYVRVYHPCSSSNGTGSLENPWIYAAMLATAHSFLVDNFNCGKALGELHIWGAIAQDYRGIVGQVGGSGYIKDYKYDNRLATDEPPYFLAPLKAGWKIARETAPGPG